MFAANDIQRVQFVERVESWFDRNMLAANDSGANAAERIKKELARDQAERAAVSAA